jgi:hypothetical protein
MLSYFGRNGVGSFFSAGKYEVTAFFHISFFFHHFSFPNFSNRLIRPRARYTGPPRRPVKALAER